MDVIPSNLIMVGPNQRIQLASKVIRFPHDTIYYVAVSEGMVVAVVVGRTLDLRALADLPLHLGRLLFLYQSATEAVSHGIIFCLHRLYVRLLSARTECMGRYGGCRRLTQSHKLVIFFVEEYLMPDDVSQKSWNE